MDANSSVRAPNSNKGVPYRARVQAVPPKTRSGAVNAPVHLKFCTECMLRTSASLIPASDDFEEKWEGNQNAGEVEGRTGGTEP